MPETFSLSPEIRRRLDCVLARRDEQVGQSARRAISYERSGPQPSDPGEPVEALTKRELETLQCIADGMTNREVGLHLMLSPETVKTYVRRILLKLETSSRAHAVATGLRRGWID